MDSDVTTIKIPTQFERPVMALRITPWDYCVDFVNNGVIHFSNTDIWRDPTSCSEGQYDPNEGCFYSGSVPIDDTLAAKKIDFIKVLNNNQYKYYREKEIFGCCFYGILLSAFSDYYETPWHTQQRRFTVSSDYFSDFYPKLTKELYGTMDKQRRPGVIFIYDFWKLVEHITRKLIEIGCMESDILFGPVYYNKGKQDYFMNLPEAGEYFIKDPKYSSQHEYRIIINTNKKSVIKYLNDNNGNIEVGNLSMIATVQSFYFDEFDLAIEGSKLLYKLAEPQTEHISEMDFKRLSSLLLQIQMNLLPQGKLEKKEQDKMIMGIAKVIDEKYGIKYDQERAAFENISYGLYKQLPEWYKQQRPFFPTEEIMEEIRRYNEKQRAH